MLISLDVRAARPEDVASLAELEVELFGSLGYPAALFRQAIDTFGPGVYVVGESATVAAYGLVVAGAETPTGWLWSMGVRSTARRQGLGRALVAHGIELMRSSAMKTMMLTVEPDNEIAIGLYRSFDFRIVSREPHYFGQGEHRLVMEAAL